MKAPKPFSTLTLREKTAIQIRWFCGTMHNLENLTVDKLLPIQEWPSQVIDDNSYITEFVELLPTSVAEFIMLHKHSVQGDRCGKCRGTSGKGSALLVEWIQCDHCLTWYHNACINLKPGNTSLYICDACI